MSEESPKKRRGRRKPAHDEPAAPAVEGLTAAEAEVVIPEPQSSGRGRLEDLEVTVNLSGDAFKLPGRDDLDAPTMTALPDDVEAALAVRMGPAAKPKRARRGRGAAAAEAAAIEAPPETPREEEETPAASAEPADTSSSDGDEPAPSEEPVTLEPARAAATGDEAATDTPSSDDGGPTFELVDDEERDEEEASEGGAPPPSHVATDVAKKHLKGLLEALVFASDRPIKAGELARAASAPVKQVRPLLAELVEEYRERGIRLDEVAGGYVFRTSAAYAPFVRDQSAQKPVRLTRAQVETLAIIAYRQPITRPEVDDIRGVDTGPVMKLLLERDLVRILGKKDEPGRPLLYGTTHHFLEFFGLRSLKDLPTLQEFTELTEESRDTYESEIGEAPGGIAPPVGEAPANDGGSSPSLGDSTDHPSGFEDETDEVRVGEGAGEERAPEGEVLGEANAEVADADGEFADAEAGGDAAGDDADADDDADDDDDEDDDDDDDEDDDDEDDDDEDDDDEDDDDDDDDEDDDE